MITGLIADFKKSPTYKQMLKELIAFCEPALVLDFVSDSVFISERPALYRVCQDAGLLHAGTVDALSQPCARGFVWALCFYENKVALMRVEVELPS